MKSSTRLDSAVFQLTPTRTRCDLVINANGKTEKIASGLVNPFIAHLNTAKDQMAKGGYSIVLEPQPGTDAAWFTRAIIESFVRFVSTPEILERVYTLESEILQLEDTITIQKNTNSELTTVDRHQAKPVESSEGSRSQPDFDNEKALVLYEPGAQPPKSNGSTADGNTKVQLMKVLETRKTALQNEQGMAFARAVAAGFDIDHMTALMSFAESFGASRLMDACVRFKELWKRKHESGQWVDIEAADAISCRSDFSAMNASGIVLSTSDNNGKLCAVQTSAEQKPLADQQLSSGHQFQGQFPHPMCPPWPMLSSPGSLPALQGYPVQGVPYYPNYPGASPYFQPMYPSGEESTPNTGQRMGRRHSMDSGTEPEAWEADDRRTKSLDNRESRRKSGRSRKNQSGTVVIRNLNYISERKNSSDSESESASDSEADEESGESSTHRGSPRSSKRKGNKAKFTDQMASTVTEGTVDGGQWQAFQNFLLKDADETEHAADRDMLEMEKNVRARRSQNALGYDPMIDGSRRDTSGDHNGNMADMQKISGKLAHVMKSSNDELSSSKEDQFPDGGGLDIGYAEINGRRGGYRRTANDDFLVVRREQQPGSSFSDSMVVNGLELAKNNIDRTNYMDDESYILQLRSSSQSQFGNDRNAVDVDSEFPTNVKVPEKVEYEPDYSSLMPERDTGKEPLGYDPAIYYSLQNETLPSLSKKTKDGATNLEEGSKKLLQNRRSKLTQDNSKKVGPIRKGKPSKSSPLDEARARAEKLRSFKADLQKMKKEKEEEDIKRLEALKLERQKRIAARSGNAPALSASQQSKKQLPTKASPLTRKGSKFSDSVPGPVSPLQRFPTRTVSAGSAESLNGSKPGKLSTGSHSNGNPLRRSASSLPESRKEKNDATPDAKAATPRLRRLSEPKISSSPLVSSVKPRNSEPVSKRKVASAPESKKITAIVNHDKNKSAALPELKIRPTKGSGLSKENTAHKEVSKLGNGVKSISSSKSIEFGRDTEKISHVTDDDGPVIEKTVVMLEYEKPSVPVGNPSSLEENLEQPKEHSCSNKVKEIQEPVVDHGALHKPVSHPMERQPIESHILDKPRDSEATKTTRNADMTSTKSSSDSLGGEPYQAPYARVSSLEDPCTRNSQYGIAPPSSLHMDATGKESHKAHVADPTSFKLERIPEASRNPQVKESSKGFRRLLKFGRKGNNTTSDNASEADNISLNGSDAEHNGANATSSSEANTLKNLISQDETPIAGYTPQKSSKHFSLLSPFRSKSGEKKQTA